MTLEANKKDNSASSTNSDSSLSCRKIHRGAQEGKSWYLAQNFTRTTAFVLTTLSVILCFAMLMSNLLATKLWHIGPIYLDGGFILFPLVYVITDVLVELFYRRVANAIVFGCCILNVIGFFCLQLTTILPAMDGTTEIELIGALGLSARIMIASAIATAISTVVNNQIYDRMRLYESSHACTQREIRRRAWWSSFFAHIPDSCFFTFAAFGGLTDFQNLVHLAITSYLSAIVVEFALLPITGLVASRLRTLLNNSEE